MLFVGNATRSVIAGSGGPTTTPAAGPAVVDRLKAAVARGKGCGLSPNDIWALVGALERAERQRDAARMVTRQWDAQLDVAVARAERAEQALRFYADLVPNDIPYADTINDPPDVGRVARAVLAGSPDTPPAQTEALEAPGEASGAPDGEETL